MAQTGRIEKCTKDLVHKFSDEELLALAREQAEKSNEMRSVEADKKRVMSDFKARLDTLDAELGVLSRKISTGYEYRKTPCEKVFHDPKPGKKTLYRVDGDKREIVEVGDMTALERQEDLPLDETGSEPVTVDFRATRESFAAAGSTVEDLSGEDGGES